MNVRLLNLLLWLALPSCTLSIAEELYVMNNNVKKNVLKYDAFVFSMLYISPALYVENTTVSSCQGKLSEVLPSFATYSEHSLVDQKCCCNCSQ